MATPPTRVSYHVQSTTPFLSTGTSKTCTGVTFQVGDFLEVKASGEQHGTSATVTPTLSAGAATWTKYADQGTGTSQSGTWSWVGVVTTAATGATVTLARPTGTNIQWGFTVSVIRGSSGIGVRFEGNNGTASGAPSVTQTVQANSLLTCQINDWNATDGTSRTWRTVNGSPITEASYYRSASTHTIYGGYVADSGVGGSVTMGLTAPATQRWVMSGFEFLGASGGSAETGMLSASVPRATSSIAGTVAPPPVTGAPSASVPTATASIAGTAVAPAYSGTLSASTPATTASLPGSVAGPSSTGTIAATTPPVTGSTAGTVTPPTYSGLTSASVPKVTGSMSGTATPPTFSGTLTATVSPTRSTITGTVTTPAGAATLSASVPRVTGSASGTVAAPVWTATLAAQVARATSGMVGTVTAPVFVGTIDGTLPGVTGAVSGSTTAPTGSGSLSASMPRLTGALSGSVTAGPPPELVDRDLSATDVPPTHAAALVPARFAVTAQTPTHTSAAVRPRYTSRSLP